MRLAMLVTDGFGVRNFILGKFLSLWTKDGSEVDLFHQIPTEALAEYQKGLSERISWHQLLLYEEKVPLFVVRQSTNYAQMNWARTQAMLRQLRSRRYGSARYRFLLRLSKLIGKGFAEPSRIEFLSLLHLGMVKQTAAYRTYLSLFKQTRPDILFSTHQWNPAVAAPVAAAKTLGIPTATFIFSWDNLTSKGRIISPFDHYFLWSDLMRKELIRYHPSIREEQTHIIGTPQFDFYGDRSLIWERNHFFQHIGADPNRPLICYSGGHKSTHPDEEMYLRVLLEMIRSGQIENSPQVVFRVAPTDFHERFNEVLKDFPEIINLPPIWKIPTQPNEYACPMPADIVLLTNLLHYCDLNINLCSTMTIDFAIFDKPVINPAFDMTSPPIHGVPLWNFYYMFEHYRPVIDLNSVRVAHNSLEMAEHINLYLRHPELEREGRKRLVDLEINGSIGQANTQLVQVLREVSQRESSYEHA